MDVGFFGLGPMELIVLAGCCGFVPLAALVGALIWYLSSKDSDSSKKDD